MFKNIILAFLPMFVAVDAMGILPVYIALTKDASPEEKRKILIQSVLTAICFAMVFLFLGKAIFRILNITIGDFMIAGGALLFSIALIDILNPVNERRFPVGELGAVPIATPLIVGPAVLTTILLIMDLYGFVPTFVSLLSNIILVGFVLFASEKIDKLIGQAGAKVLSKIASLFLAAIAVMLVRKGIIFVLSL